ncbi:MAG: DUF4062 domain-containing protein [Halobacteriota archaeon]
MVKNLHIFVSSRISNDELKEEREIAREVIESTGSVPLMWELFGAAPKSPNERSLDKVKECDIFVQILGRTITSIVKNEYDTAKTNAKPVLILIKKEENRTSELVDYIKNLEPVVSYTEFSTVEDFKVALTKSLFEQARSFNAESRQSMFDMQHMNDRIRKFRDERIQKMLVYEPRLHLDNNAKTVLQLIPIDAFHSDKRYDNTNVIFHDNEALKPMFRYKSTHPYLGFSNVIERKYNRDGIKKYSTFTCYDEVDGKPNYYKEPYTCVQLFGNGIIEAVEQRELNSIKGTKVIFDEYERGLINSLSNYLDVFKILGVAAPVFFFLTLLGVKGYRLSRGYKVFDQKIDEDILAIPEKIIEKFDDKPEHILRPCFDYIWNACGYPKCFNYDEEGNWTVNGTDKRIRDYIKASEVH